MVSGSVARRYARALFDLAVEQGQEQVVQEQLASLADAASGSREVRDLFENPAYGREQRGAAVEALCKQMGSPPLLRNFLMLLVDRNRLSRIESIASYFGELADARAGRVRATIVSAVALDDAAASKLSQALERVTGRRVVLEKRVEASVLGGVVAQLAGRVYDGSLRTQLEELKHQLRAN